MRLPEERYNKLNCWLNHTCILQINRDQFGVVLDEILEIEQSFFVAIGQLLGTICDFFIGWLGLLFKYFVVADVKTHKLSVLLDNS